jgi:hypothetical protein
VQSTPATRNASSCDESKSGADSALVTRFLEVAREEPSDGRFPRAGQPNELQHH